MGLYVYVFLLLWLNDMNRLVIILTLLISSSSAYASDIVISELGLGEPKTDKSKSHECGSFSNRWWFNHPVRIFKLNSWDVSSTCEWTPPNLESHIKTWFNKSVTLSNFGPLGEDKTAYMEYEYMSVMFSTKNKPAAIPCFGFRSETIGSNSIYSVMGMYCGRETHQSEQAFKNQLSKIRWDFQVKKKDAYIPSTSADQTPVKAKNPSVNSDPNTTSQNVEERLQAIKRLLDNGLISEDEAKTKRRELLDKL